MKATLYDALGISPTSSDEEVRAALRGLIRKYYAKTRDGQGNVEEALRFINHASRILGDGAMPSFSPKGNRIAFSRYSERGVWVMSAPRCWSVRCWLGSTQGTRIC